MGNKPTGLRTESGRHRFEDVRWNVARLSTEGLTYKEIGSVYGRHPQTIFNLMGKHERRVRWERERDERLVEQEAAERRWKAQRAADFAKNPENLRLRPNTTKWVQRHG